MAVRTVTSTPGIKADLTNAGAIWVDRAMVVSAGGRCEREPQWEDGEPPHLAMCEDPEGNQFILSRQRN